MIKRLPNPNRWAVLPASAFEDPRLSWKARGLLAFILVKPDDWEIRRDNLIAASEKDGETSVKSALKELVDAGYAELVTVRQEDSTQVAGKRYEVSDYPRVENPIVGSPHDGETTPITYIPEETKDQKKDYRPEDAQKRAREEIENSDCWKTDEGRRRFAEDARPSNLYVDQLTYVEGPDEDGDEPVMCRSPYPDDPDRSCLRELGHDGKHSDLADRWKDQGRLATGEDDGIPEVCRHYQPGFDCVHMGHVVDVIATQWWGPVSRSNLHQLVNEFRHTKEALHTAAHAYTLEDIATAAQHWKASGEKMRMQLLVTQLASTLANAQSVQAPGAEPAWARYARKLEERGE